MEDIIVIAILVVIIGLAALYIYKAKKSGKKCIGCPDGCSCSTKENKTANSESSSCGGCCSCCSGCSGSGTEVE